MNHGVVKMVPVHCNLHKECVFVLFCAIVLNVKASVFPCIAGLLVLLSGIFLAHTKWPGFLGVRSRWGWCQPLNHLVENVRRSCRCYVVRRVDWVCWISEHCQGCWTCSHQQRVLLHFSESSLGVGVLPQVGIPDICRCIQGEGCVCDEMCMSIGLCIIYIYIYIGMYIVFSAHWTLCGWLGSKHQVTVLCTSREVIHIWHFTQLLVPK